MVKRARIVETIWGPVPVRRRGVGEAGQRSIGEVVTWGGRREGAGKKRGPRPRVPHRRRERHRGYQPVHLTLRRAKGVPSLRTERLADVVAEALRATARACQGAFRVTHYSVQADHVHLIVEADDVGDDAGLSRGARSLAIRIALAVNRLLGRKRGRVWADRYHARELTTPAEVRNALVYVLANHLKHGELDVGLVDPCSSGPWFEGWMQVLERPPDPSPVEAARTWLLDWGWHRGRNYIHLGEVPRELRPPARR